MDPLTFRLGERDLRILQEDGGRRGTGRRFLLDYRSISQLHFRLKWRHSAWWELAYGTIEQHAESRASRHGGNWTGPSQQFAREPSLARRDTAGARCGRLFLTIYKIISPLHRRHRSRYRWSDLSLSRRAPVKVCVRGADQRCDRDVHLHLLYVIPAVGLNRQTARSNTVEHYLLPRSK